jgi:hypothetical protein
MPFEHRQFGIKSLFIHLVVVVLADGIGKETPQAAF